jgi:hypothetical protein
MQQQERVWAAFTGDRTRDRRSWFTFALVFTDRQLIVGQHNEHLLMDALRQAHIETEGLDETSRLVASIKAPGKLAKRYYTEPLSSAMAELGSPVFIPFKDIRSMYFYLSPESTIKNAVTGPEYRLNLDSKQLKDTFRLIEWPGQEVTTLKQMFGDRLKY